MYTVSSEIYSETDFQSAEGPNGRVVSKFKFHFPNDDDDAIIEEIPAATVDEDGDLVVRRRPAVTSVKCGQIEIQHSRETELRLVGLQVWRGALLLADFFFHRRADFQDMQVLELGGGVGLTSIAASIFVRKVICSDVDVGGILDLIRFNIENNHKLIPCNKAEVLEYDFMQNPRDYSVELLAAIDGSDLIVAADVIYDEDLTDAFIRVIDTIFAREAVSGRKKRIYVALEKRFVFTLSEMDAVAPMFEYFIKQTLNKTWSFEYLATDFPQYFEYERCKHLVLMQLTSS